MRQAPSANRSRLRDARRLKNWQTCKDAARLFGDSKVGRQLRAQTPLQFLAQLRHFHARHYDELTAQHLARFIIIRQLAGNAAILAFLVPAESAVRDRFRADELETAQKRIALG